MTYCHQLWSEEPLLGQGHAGVTQGQPEVKLLRNPLFPTNLITRTADAALEHMKLQVV